MSSWSSHTPWATVKCGPSTPRLSRWAVCVRPYPGHRLHLGFGNVAVQRDAELARQIGAAKDEAVGTVMRYRRRDPRDAPGRGRKTSLLPLVADLRRPANCDRVVAMTVSRFGGVKILVNNADLTSRR